jgi:hypothetical protein
MRLVILCGHGKTKRKGVKQCVRSTPLGVEGPIQREGDSRGGTQPLGESACEPLGVASETGYTTSSSDAYHFVPLRGNQARIR